MPRYTRIIYNGPFLEERVRSIEELIYNLEKEPLHSVWEIGNGFVYQIQTSTLSYTVFQGRFATSYYRFRVETNDESVIEKLTAAIQDNMNSYQYKKLRTLQFAQSFKKALVKQVEAAQVSQEALYLKEKYKVSGRPEKFESIYQRFEWEDGCWISNEDLLHCTLELGYDLVLTEEDKFPKR